MIVEYLLSIIVSFEAYIILLEIYGRKYIKINF